MSFLPICDVAKIKESSEIPKFGKVIYNEDPKKLGRVKVSLPGIFEGEPEQLPWVRRKMDTLFCGLNVEVFDVPEVDSIVQIQWDYDKDTPVYTGAPYNEAHTSKLFHENYPHEGGFKFGKNYIKFNKEKPELVITNGDGNVITLSPEGKTTIQCKNLDIEVEETANLKCENFNIKASKKVDIDTPQTHISGNVEIDKNLHVKGVTRDDIDVIAQRVSLVGHTHRYIKPKHGRGYINTACPTQ